MIRVAIVLAVASRVLGGNACAATYKWVDDQGVTHYGEKLPPGQKAQEVKIRTSPSAPPPPPSPAAAADAGATKGKEGAPTYCKS